MPDLLNLSTDQWIAFWTGAVTGLLGIAALAGTAFAVVLTVQANAREAKRDEQLDRDRVDKWLADFIEAATRYWTDCDGWVKAEQNRQYRERMGAADEDDVLPKPKAGPMLGALDSARLVARLNDREPLKLLSEAVAELRKIEIPRREGVLEVLTGGVRDWRSDWISTADLESRLVKAVEDARSTV